MFAICQELGSSLLEAHGPNYRLSFRMFLGPIRLWPAESSSTITANTALKWSTPCACWPIPAPAPDRQLFSPSTGQRARRAPRA